MRSGCRPLPARACLTGCTARRGEHSVKLVPFRSKHLAHRRYGFRLTSPQFCERVPATGSIIWLMFGTSPCVRRSPNARTSAPGCTSRTRTQPANSVTPFVMMSSTSVILGPLAIHGIACIVPSCIARSGRSRPYATKADFGTALTRRRLRSMLRAKPWRTISRQITSAGHNAPATNGALLGIGTRVTSSPKNAFSA